MPTPSTISFADLYGSSPPGRSRGDAAPADTEKASGSVGSLSDNKPVMWWLAMVGFLTIVRILWEKGKKL